MIASPNAKTPFLHGYKRRLNGIAICINIFIPWFLFMGVAAALSFDLHYYYPGLSWLIVGVAALVVFISAGLAASAKKNDEDPSWYAFATLACLVAVVAAAVLGDFNFQLNMSPYYDINNLQVYPNVRPDVDRGQALMDAGKVYFTEGSKLDPATSVGFKNGDRYCVAPIVREAPGVQMKTYDFWAVGKNCCAERSDFRCGEYANRKARNGLRLMHDEDRPFYRLAVQSAEAVYGIKADHPLFFYWMEDPLAEQEAYRDEGMKWFLIAIFSHFAFNLLCVVAAAIGFAKIGARY